MERQQYLALLATADVFLSTTLREGINIGSHEFVLSQDGLIPGSKKHGVLIMSEFSGNITLFGESSMFISPWDYRRCAAVIKLAVEMDEQEKSRRWEALYKCVREQDAHTWFTRCNMYLNAASSTEHNRDFVSTPRLSIRRLREKSCEGGVLVVRT
jgi:trehalose 6-phosphate synthase/phosphatase